MKAWKAFHRIVQICVQVEQKGTNW